MELKWKYSEGWLFRSKLESEIRLPLTKKRLFIQIRPSGRDWYWSIRDKDNYLADNFAQTIPRAEKKIIKALELELMEDKRQHDKDMREGTVASQMESEVLDFLASKGTPESRLARWWRKTVGRHL